MVKKDKRNYETMDTNSTNKTNRRRSNQDVSTIEDVSSAICSDIEGRLGEGQQLCRLCNSGDADGDETSVSKGGEDARSKTRRTKLNPIRVNSFYDTSGIYYSANQFWKVWKFIPHNRPYTKLEVAYVRIQKIQALLHSLYESGVRRNDYDSVYGAKHQQAGIVEALRILQQEILLERGYDREKLITQENERIWEQDI